ncbi:DNA-binding MarR family transcriptional regulator [Paraburkholderia sp. UCT70]|uniref:MarR family winged helix-turn-helix transcriptional regulator n=1 Tax=Paraburkholderia sp. UCT70 TaxID=2991068 RepID=UPI003D1C40CF
MLCREAQPPKAKPGPQRRYDDEVRAALITLWEAADRICGKRLNALIPTLIDSMTRHGPLTLSKQPRQRLNQISAATIDRRRLVPSTFKVVHMRTAVTEPIDIQSIRAELAERQARSPLFSRPGFLIRRMHQIHTFLFAQETSEFNITPVQFSLLTALDSLGEMDQNTLATEVGLERSSVAEVIPRLNARGLVSRTQAEHDKRLRLVKLTPAGKRLVKKMGQAVQRAHDRTIEHLSPLERDVFMLQMIRLVEANNSDSLVPLHLPDSQLLAHDESSVDVDAI